MKRPATVFDVARDAGVSIATVSYVINGKPGVRHETRLKVLDSIRRLQYVPNGAAVSLVSRNIHHHRLRTGCVGFVVSKKTSGGFEHPIIARILNGVSVELERLGMRLTTHLISTDALHNHAYPSALKPGVVDGLIFAGGNPGAIVQYARATNIPIVLAESSCDIEAVDTVMLDNVQAAYAAVSYLFDHGHERIGLIIDARPVSNLTPLRFQGYLNAHLKAGIPLDPDRIVDSTLDYESGRQAIRKLLERSPHVTAIFALNDYAALGAMAEAQARGIGVPEEISIMGFDDLEISAQVHPGLTTVRAPAECIGTVAARRLCELLNSIDPSPRRQLLFGELVCRGSVRAIGAPVRRAPLPEFSVDAEIIRRLLRTEGS